MSARARQAGAVLQANVEPGAPAADGHEQLVGIGAAAEKAGVSQRALRYYQELGLLTPCGCTPGGLRRYVGRFVESAPHSWFPGSPWTTGHLGCRSSVRTIRRSSREAARVALVTGSDPVWPTTHPTKYA